MPISCSEYQIFVPQSPSYNSSTAATVLYDQSDRCRCGRLCLQSGVEFRKLGLGLRAACAGPTRHPSDTPVTNHREEFSQTAVKVVRVDWYWQVLGTHLLAPTSFLTANASAGGRLRLVTNNSWRSSGQIRRRSRMRASNRDIVTHTRRGRRGRGSKDKKKRTMGIKRGAKEALVGGTVRNWCFLVHRRRCSSVVHRNSSDEGQETRERGYIDPAQRERGWKRSKGSLAPYW